MLVTNTVEIAQKAKCLRNYGQSVRYYHPEIGMNSRLDELQAAILSVRLNWLSEFTEYRKKIASTYRSGINTPKVKLPPEPQETDAHVYHLFVITCDKRDQLIKYLQSKDIQSLIHYPVPVHHQEPCNGMLMDPNGLINSETHAKECLSLPCHPQMTNEEVNMVISAINSF